MMSYRIFLAGASGAIGRRLTPLLHSAGHYVCSSTRSKTKADALRSLGVDALEDLSLKSPPLEGVVLRYGQLYGPGTSSDRPSDYAPIHVDAAAYAALLAINHGSPGIYNIAQSSRHIATEKARVGLGWTPDFRLQA
jgi:nucleoside-diphosphate-sugar epimerase